MCGYGLGWVGVLCVCVWTHGSGAVEAGLAVERQEQLQSCPHLWVLAPRAEEAGALRLEGGLPGRQKERRLEPVNCWGWFRKLNIKTC